MKRFKGVVLKADVGWFTYYRVRGWHRLREILGRAKELFRMDNPELAEKYKDFLDALDLAAMDLIASTSMRYDIITERLKSKGISPRPFRERLFACLKTPDNKYLCLTMNVVGKEAAVLVKDVRIDVWDELPSGNGIVVESPEELESEELFWEFLEPELL